MNIYASPFLHSQLEVCVSMRFSISTQHHVDSMRPISYIYRSPGLRSDKTGRSLQLELERICRSDFLRFSQPQMAKINVSGAEIF
jgi:hypothetical protein